MKMRALLLTGVAMAVSTPAWGQAVQEIEVTDGTDATCYRPDGPSNVNCGFFPVPTVDTFVADGAGNSSEITTQADRTEIETTAANGDTALSRQTATQDLHRVTSASGSDSFVNIYSHAAAMQSSDASIGLAEIGTQVGTSSLTGRDGGQIFANATSTDPTFDSSLAIELTQGMIRTRNTATGYTNFVATGIDRTIIGIRENGTDVATITTTQAGHAIIGNTSITGTLSVTDVSTLNGIDNQSAGITNAGLISGVTPGAVTATSTEAVNGSQLFATNQAVATAQTTADTALANAATAQATADTALANAATAQTTADTALANAATAQTTADTALANAATAQTTADTALANAATAQTTATGAATAAAAAQTSADNAQTTADTALANAATAQTAATSAGAAAAAAQTSADNAQDTADTALANAATAQTTATGAATAAASAQTAAATAVTNSEEATVVANEALTTANGIATTANTALTNSQSAMATANAAQTLASGFDSRITSLESGFADLRADLNQVNADASRGVAIASAFASIPDIDSGKNFGVGVGVGHYNSKTAFSIAVGARASENAEFRLNIGTTGSGKVAVGGGSMFSW